MVQQPGEGLRIVEVVGSLPYASNTTVLGRSDNGDLWVYKPVTGEQPLWDFAWRSLAAREVLTFEVSEAMGLGIVPETRLAEGPYGRGSAQRFLAEDDSVDHRTLFHPHLDPRLWPFAVLDIVTNNADRKVGHFLAETGSGRLWGIDHGLTFHALPKLRTVLWGFAGMELPGELLDSVRRLREALVAGFGDRVADLLSLTEAEALVQRVEDLLDHPLHPQPPEDRPPLPWPIW